MNNYVGFPGLGIELSISNVAFSIGKIDIYWYGIIIGAALLIGYLLAYNTSKRNNIDPDNITNIILICAPVAVIFARLYYVVFSLDYYSLHPEKILAIRDGGIAIYGAVIGAVISCYVYCKVKKLDTMKIFDICIPSVILGQAIGRWGNFFNKEAFGTETASLLRMAIYKSGKIIEVHPTFLYESIWNLIVFTVLLYTNKNKKFKGQTFVTYVTLYGLGRFFIEGLRTDSLFIGPLRISQLIALCSFIAGSLILIIKTRKTSSK